MSELSNEREIFIKKWIKELAIKLQKSEKDLLLEGIQMMDFKNNVFIEHEDGSSCFYKYAFYVENEKEYAIFTEHCDYHEFKKEWLNRIEEGDSVNIEQLVRIKWIGDGNAYIEADKERLSLNKMQMKSLQKELNNFINYYSEDFSPDQLRLLKNLSENKH